MDSTVFKSMRNSHCNIYTVYPTLAFFQSINLVSDVIILLLLRYLIAQISGIQIWTKG